jgi:sugar O-acyltransferase (sialic acid O-acetyltransferase NeuD family)
MTTKKKLIIVGGGALGREVLLYAQDMIAAQTAGLLFDGFAGFLDEATDAADQLRALGVDFEWVEPIDEHHLREDCVYVLAVGTAKARRNILNRLDGNTSWTNIVHPTAYLASSATLAEGVILAPFAFVGANATLGDHVVLNTYASVGHDSQVGSCCVLSPYAVINGNVTLGEQTFMGTHATVIPRRKIGKGSSLSAGAVVVRDVEPGFFMMGNPARGWRMDSDDSH